MFSFFFLNINAIEFHDNRESFFFTRHSKRNVIREGIFFYVKCKYYKKYAVKMISVSGLKNRAYI